MGIYMLGISLGNFYVAGVNFFMEQTKDAAGNTLLDGPNYYWFFSALMIVTTVIYIIYTQFYKGKTFIQGEDDPDSNPDSDPDDNQAIKAESKAEGTEAR